MNSHTHTHTKVPFIKFYRSKIMSIVCVWLNEFRTNERKKKQYKLANKQIEQIRNGFFLFLLSFLLLWKVSKKNNSYTFDYDVCLFFVFIDGGFDRTWGHFDYVNIDDDDSNILDRIGSGFNGPLIWENKWKKNENNLVIILKVIEVCYFVFFCLLFFCLASYV